MACKIVHYFFHFSEYLPHCYIAKTLKTDMQLVPYKDSKSCDTTHSNKCSITILLQGKPLAFQPTYSDFFLSSEKFQE